MMEKKLVFKQSNKKMKIVPYIIGCAILAILCFIIVFLPGSGAVIAGLVSSGFFAILSLILIWIWANSEENSLIITSEGFTISSASKNHLYRWKEVEGFKMYNMYNNNMIVFNFSQAYNKHAIARQIASNISGGYEGAIADMYDVKLEELLKILTQWKKKYG